MKIVLAFEHIRRILGARSQIVMALARHLHARGHEVIVLCDTVTDPTMYPEITFITRRVFQSGDSHRFTLLRAWARRMMQDIDHDAAISFHPAIPAEHVAPVFGWLDSRLRHEHEYLKKPLRRLGAALHPRSIERRMIESLCRRDHNVKSFIALSQRMADDLVHSHPELRDRVQIIPGASPVEPPDDPDQLSALRREGRRLLGVDDDTIVYLWASKLQMTHGRAAVLEAFAELILRGHRGVHLVIAGDGHWQHHQKTTQLGCEDHVHIVGRTAEMRLLLAACDIGINPAVHSTLGQFVWECLAFGRPVIASANTGSVDRLINDRGDVAGRIVPAYDRAAVRDAISDLALDAGERARVTEVARGLSQSMRFDRFVDDIERLLMGRITRPVRADVNRSPLEHV